MTTTADMLLAGWIVFLIVGLSWHTWRVIGDYHARRLVPPRRYLYSRLVLVGGSVVWLALIGLSAGVPLLNLAFGFVLVVIPAAVLCLVSGYRADRRRYDSMSARGPHGGR